MKVKADLYNSELAIVMIGNFNPVVFQPAWFSNQKLMRSAEADSANINVIHPDVVSFSTEWFSLQVTRDRFTVLTTSEPHHSHVLDLVIGTFTKLQHTPVSQMGINTAQTIVFENFDDWHNFGHYLVPKSPWSGLVKNPGMLALNLKTDRPDSYHGMLHVSVEYEGKLKTRIKCNDHFDISPGEKKDQSSAQFFTRLLQNEFATSVERTGKLTSDLLQRFSILEKFDDGTD